MRTDKWYLRNCKIFGKVCIDGYLEPTDCRFCPELLPCKICAHSAMYYGAHCGVLRVL